MYYNYTRNMEPYIEKKMETTRIFWWIYRNYRVMLVYIGIMEQKLETTIMVLYGGGG